ncbi:unnamed protein product [Aspergillus oryzae RIB40]|uniref:DNA, SC001 n=2 Tax=Aspergillus oryzae TaxID=5062 RepID=Q2UPC8_ASPOR|nr:unnamed protein product [Aspergillus oryzae RIB40]EIT80981.1 hypothetical protein Ao3042_02567 [Aspergillus oryzae 3.042]KDE83320.1 hypothetical protein AO1008_09838 [Aspergillus oryzae 100-8]BAE56587.1 unnamed protein product [Aspergillus oryzae RIB40]|eukprot:EIT80981.1 hypothetical protein Ao3042_02567 [Aspergillus oryzae 3.042]
MELSRSLLEATLTADCPQNQYGANKGHVLGLDFHEIARRSDRVIGLSMLTLIYRSIPPEKPSMSAFCQECIDAARDTLREHDLCVALITRARGKTVFLEAYINWTITQSPFIPFIILFCHIIETSEAADLQHMKGLVETLESASNSRVHSTCSKQRRLFRALYDVAAQYVEIRSRANGGRGGMSWSVTRQQYADAFASATSNGLGFSTLGSGETVGALGTMNPADASGPMASHDKANGDRVGLVDGLVEPMELQNTAFGDIDIEMDYSGAQLWDWFNKNQAFMRMLEDT